MLKRGLTTAAVALVAIGGVALSTEQSRFDIQTSFTPLIYGDSPVKKSGYYIGTHLYYTYGKEHVAEFAADYLRIKYKNTDFKLRQYDFTLSYTNYSLRNYKLRGGIHYISNNDDATDKAITAFGEVLYYVPLRWNAGLEAYITYYPDHPYGGMGEKGVYVYQLNPKVGAYVRENVGAGSLYFELKPYFIRVSRDVGWSKNHFSVELTATYSYKNWVLSGFGYAGNQLFPVRYGGFVVYNFAEKRTSGYGLSAKYIFHPKASVSFTLFQDNFKYPGADKTSTLTTTLLSLGYTF